MTAVLDNQPLIGLHYANMPPTFNNPWGNATTSPTAPLYASSVHAPHSDYDNLSRHSSISIAYSNTPQDMLSNARPFGADYHSSAAPSHSSFAPIANTSHFASDYSNVPTYNYPESEASRRSSYSMKMNAARASFSDALDASRGMVAMSQDMTPRNIYGTTATRHASHDYGFPQHASHNSSISSASTYQSYYGGSYSGSVDGGSVTDYSSASDEALGASRILPAPAQLIGGFPPEPASMMTQFNSKASLSASKKHKCKTCDKRFTRPSSLQTHMYSHTGEKPFACDHAGCGRHFSVVSNLRRHKKVHDPNRDED